MLTATSIEDRLPLLITGLAGVAGYNAFAYFREKYPGQVFALRRQEYWSLAGPGILACDTEDSEAFRRLLDVHEFRSILHCCGSCALKSCELDPSMAYRVNVNGIANLIDQVEKVGANVRLVCLSIDLVYSGTAGGSYVETDPTDPVTEYGKSMVLAEQLISARRSDAAILRISLPMGISFNGHAGAIDWIQNRFKHGRPATLYYDEVRTPTYTDCLNRVLESVLANDMAGVYHTGGPRRLSLYEIAQIVNRVGGYDPRKLHGCFRIQAGPMPPRAGNVSMVSQKLADAIGYLPFDPWPLRDEFVPTDRHWHFDRPAGEKGSPQFLKEMLYHNPRFALAANR